VGPYGWTREEYEQAAEAGLFQDRRVELVDGAVYDMAAQLSPPDLSARRDDRAAGPPRDRPRGRRSPTARRSRDGA